MTVRRISASGANNRLNAGTVPVLSSAPTTREKLLLWLPLWLCAILILFGNLDTAPLMGSEGRWAGVVREMFLSKDFLHPTVNFEPYFDKPLLSYWFIALVTLVNRGIVTEFFARVPSAVSAMAALWAVISISKTLFSTRCAVVSSWIFLTVYSFAFWGRLAEADMMNLAFSTCAVAWYLKRRDGTGLAGYSGFFLLCFVGAHAKGMGAIAVPIMLAGLDMILRKTWKKHLNWKSMLALSAGIGVYMLPFWLSKTFPPAVPVDVRHAVDFDGTVKTSGIALAVRENVIRFFKPFDHNDEGIFAYFVHVPRLCLPWTPLIVLAFLTAFFRLFKKKLTDDGKWLFFSVVAIFVLFTASGSRRVYYILPVVPYCAILCGNFLTEKQDFPLIEKLNFFLLKIYADVPKFALCAAAFGAGFFAIFPKFIPAELTGLSSILPRTALVFAICGVMIFMLAIQLKNVPDRFSVNLPSLLTMRALMSVCVCLILVFVYLLPVASSFRGEKRAAVRMAQALRMGGVPTKNLYFYDRTLINVAFYLNRPERIDVIDRTPEGKKQLDNLLRNPPSGGFHLIAQRRFLENFPVEYKGKFERSFVDLNCPKWVRNRKKAMRQNLVMLHSLPPEKGK